MALSLAEEEGQRLVQEMDVVAVFLSGSVARGWGGEESDLDLIAITRSGEEFYTEGREMGLGERQGERQVHVADCFFRMDVADHLVSQGVSSLPAMIQDALPIHDPEDLLNTWRSNLSGKEFWTRRRAITENTHFYLVGQLENTAKEALQAGDLPRAMMAYRHIWDSLCSLALCYNRVLEKGSKLFLRQVFESQLPSWFVKSYKEVWGLRQEDPEQVQELLEKASQSLSKPQPNQHTH
jgi:predicted nucleotidyltransferase